jgi:hypothetical protein
MKKLITLFLLVSSSLVFSAETKKVCVDAITNDGKPIIDKKTGKPKQECKEMKVHKKLEGTKVPDKK